MSISWQGKRSSSSSHRRCAVWLWTCAYAQAAEQAVVVALGMMAPDSCCVVDKGSAGLYRPSAPLPALLFCMQAAGPIHIPRVRLVADYDLNQEAAEHHGPMIEGDMAAAPYLRHKEHLDMYDEHDTAEYDADDADIKWLDNINSKVGSTATAAALGKCSSQAWHGYSSVRPACNRKKGLADHHCVFVLCCLQNGQGGILAAAIGLYHQVSARISGSGTLDPSGSEVSSACLNCRGVTQHSHQHGCTHALRLSGHMGFSSLPDTLHFTV